MTGITLVTGATGFLGAAVVHALVGCGEVVRCVVRGESDADRTTRLHASAVGADSLDWDHVEVAGGDLSLECFGLDTPDFAALGVDVRRIIHCGARVNATLPYASLHEVNVRATGDVLDLAERCGATVSFVGSLAAVSSTVTNEPFELLVPVSGGYALSKWTADRMVAVAHQEGRVRATILRPGRITAGLSPARCNRDDLLERVVEICVRLRRAPHLETRVRFSPVDWVARLLLVVSSAASSYGRAYHLMHATTVEWQEFVSVLGQVVQSLELVSYSEWRTAAVTLGREDPEVAQIVGALPPEGLSFDGRDATPRRAERLLSEAYPEPPSASELLAATIQAWHTDGPLSDAARAKAGL